MSSSDYEPENKVPVNVRLPPALLAELRRLSHDHLCVTRSELQRVATELGIAAIKQALEREGIRPGSPGWEQAAWALISGQDSKARTA